MSEQIPPRPSAISLVRSEEPSSTTTILKPGSKAQISPITAASEPSSLKAGTIASRRRSAKSESAMLALILGLPCRDATPWRGERWGDDGLNDLHCLLSMATRSDPTANS